MAESVPEQKQKWLPQDFFSKYSGLKR